jgi:alpha-amylase
MNKFAIWQLTEYSRVAMIDLDAVFDFNSDNPSELFADCMSGLCAVRDGDPRFINAGLIVATPSQQRLDHIMHVLSDERHHFEMPEQSFLTRYCENSANGLQLTYLDTKWNSCVGGGMLRNSGWATSGYNVLHSCSWGAKPPNVRMCFEDECDMSAERHTALVWQHYHTKVDRCVLRSKRDSCTADASCTWCGHYCSDQRVPCSADLFSQVLDKPDEKSVHQPCREKVIFEGSWEDAPTGWWAWPRGALYQVLLDRFASVSSSQGKCDDLRRPCGGNFAGMQTKLGYLESLGVDGVIVSPVVANMPGGYHGYWPIDLDAIEPRLGSVEELKELVAASHKRGMKFMVDANLNHAGGPGVEPRELIQRLKPFNKEEHFHPTNCSLFSSADFQQPQRVLEKCQLHGLPDYNQEHPAVRQGLMQWLRRHIDTFGFDGVRIDAARHMPKDFLKHLVQDGPPIPAFHEVITSDSNTAGAYASGDFDSVYNYPLYFALRDIFVSAAGKQRQRPMSDLDAYGRQRDDSRDKLMLNFLDNNDLPRFFRLLHGDAALYRNALLYVLGAEGVPVLLYGSEQDMRGPGNATDPVHEEAPDNWRPPLWNTGYDTSGTTFRMIRRVLHLRKQLDGMHKLRQRTLHADHDVLVFARGSLTFVVGNVPSTKRTRAQRMVHNNVTEGCSAERICDVLSPDIEASCTLVDPNRPLQIEITDGEPKLFAPRRLLKHLLLEEMKHEIEAQEQKPKQEQWQAAASPRSDLDLSNIKILPRSRWHEMPRPPSTSIETVPRLPRTALGDVEMNDPPHWLPSEDVRIPGYLDQWYPPIGAAPQHVTHISAEDACIYIAPKADSTFNVMFARRGETTYLLCMDEGEYCDGAHGLQTRITPEILRNISAGQLPTVQEPVFLLLWNSLFSGGYYHAVVESLPSVAPFLADLRAGKMRFFAEEGTGKNVLEPILARLGIAGAGLVGKLASSPASAREQTPVGFCSPRLELTRDLSHPSTNLLRDLRQGLRLPVHEADDQKRIVILSRGKSSRSINNEEGLAFALQEKLPGRRPVEVLNPDDFTVDSLIERLSHAAAVVGGHGANMVNMLYAPRSTIVLEIVPQVPFKLVNYHYRALAGALKFPYAAVGQEVRSYDHVLAGDVMTQSRAILSYEVDVDKVVQTLSDMLLTHDSM